MRSRSFFIILFKIFALILLVSSIRALILSIESIAYLSSDFIIHYFAIVLMIAVFFFFIYILLFKGDYIIDKLKLTYGIDETISLNIHRSDLLHFAIIILGGYILVEEIPILCQALYNYYQEGRIEMSYSNASPKYIVYSIVRILVALLLLGNSRLIVNYIELRRKK